MKLALKVIEKMHPDWAKRAFRSKDKLSYFLDRIAANGDCLDWVGCKHAAGYGWAKWHGRMIRAHRYSYDLFVGPVGEKLHVMHLCDRPPCVNPEHLKLGTALDNQRDMVNKGRQGKRAGDNNKQSKLTGALVLNLRKRHTAGESFASVARSSGRQRRND